MTGPVRTRRPHPTVGSSIPASEVVIGVYRGLLGRDPEREGLMHQLAALGAGAALENVVHNIRVSQEAAERSLSGLSGKDAVRHRLAGMMRRPGERQIYVLHGMKTGGTALLNGLVRIAGERVCLTQIFLDHVPFLPRRLLTGASLIGGHLGSEVIPLLAPDVLTCTIIREPVARVLSHYAHVRRDPARADETTDLSLEEFLHEERWRPLASNFQARHLVHAAGVTDAWIGFSPAERLAAMGPPFPAEDVLPLQFLLDYSGMGLSEADLEHQGLASLDGVEVVGVTDDLDVPYRALAAAWGVADLPPLTRDNVGRNKVAAADVPAELRRVIVAANEVDQALYEQARRRSQALAAAHNAR